MRYQPPRVAQESSAADDATSPWLRRNFHFLVIPAIISVYHAAHRRRMPRRFIGAVWSTRAGQIYDRERRQRAPSPGADTINAHLSGR